MVGLGGFVVCLFCFLSFRVYMCITLFVVVEFCCCYLFVGVLCCSFGLRLVCCGFRLFWILYCFCFGLIGMFVGLCFV